MEYVSHHFDMKVDGCCLLFKCLVVQKVIGILQLLVDIFGDYFESYTPVNVIHFPFGNS